MYNINNTGDKNISYIYILFPKIQEGFEDSQKTANEEKKLNVRKN
jgi:hypothetical protein